MGKTKYQLHWQAKFIPSKLGSINHEEWHRTTWHQNYTYQINKIWLTTIICVHHQMHQRNYQLKIRTSLIRTVCSRLLILRLKYMRLCFRIVQSQKALSKRPVRLDMQFGIGPFCQKIRCLKNWWLYFSHFNLVRLPLLKLRNIIVMQHTIQMILDVL